MADAFFSQITGTVKNALGKKSPQPPQQQGYYPQQPNSPLQGYQPQPYPQQQASYPGAAPQGGAGYAPPPASPLPPQPSLPPGWIAQWDATHQRSFYVDTATGQSHWTLPQAPAPSPRPAFQPPPGPPPPVSGSGPNPQLNQQQGPSNMAAYYGVNQSPVGFEAMPATAQNFFKPASAADPTSSVAPTALGVGTVDPTMVIPLALTQSIPNLMKAPPPDCSIRVKDGWRQYVRSIQDAQNLHTRKIRDAQMDHEQNVKDIKARYGVGALPGFSGGGNININLGSVMGYFNRQQDYQADLDRNRKNYDVRVERSHQELNDAVERANRAFEDV
ncbi:hypothetical protein HK405_008408, partial [Cladochytrium tenue]